MPSVDVFRGLGLFVVERFCSEREYLECQAAMQGSALEYGSVRTEGSVEKIERSRRNVQIAAVPSGLKSSLGVKVGGLRPTLETHFGVRLDGCESLQFLTYSPGHFYGPHTDSTDDAEAPALIRRRKVSVVIFVNASCVAGDANGYDGGELVFYGLIKAPRFSACGLPLEAQAGMLIAFPADVVHEVRPVILGHRLTIATWFAVARD